MTPAIGHAIFAVSNSLAASIIVKATIAISIALVAATLARHSRASVRHAILAAGFAVILALPIAAVIAPPLHIALPIAQGSSIPTANSVQSFDEPTPAPGTATNAPSAAKSEATSFSLFDLLFIAWAFGAVVFLAPVIIGLWQIRSLRRTALPWSHGTSVASTLANELKISRRIEVLLHESTSGPMTCGIFHPAVVFPVEAENWNNGDLNRAVAHELEHVRRVDWLTHCLARIVCAAYWFHPFVWIAWRQLTLEAERACDDAVLAHSEATAYAEQLIALARQLTAANKSPLLAMASRSDLTARVSAVLDNQQCRGRVGSFAIALACGVAALMTSIAPFRIVAAQPQSSAQAWEKTAGGEMAFDVASVKQNDSSDSPLNNVPRSNFPLNNQDAYFDTGGLLSATKYRLDALIGFAYKLNSAQIRFVAKQLPKWANTEQFDIQARGRSNATKDQMRLMMQSLLSDRFKMTAHIKMDEGSIFALVLAKKGVTGPQLQRHSTEAPCVNLPASPTQGAPPAPSPRLPNGLPAVCGMLSTMLGPRGWRISARDITLAQLAAFLPSAPIDSLDRPIIDRTGLSGTFDLTIEFKPDTTLTLNGANYQFAESAETFLEALKDQLGLKLQATTGPVQNLIIDNIKEPTPN